MTEIKKDRPAAVAPLQLRRARRNDRLEDMFGVLLVAAWLAAWPLSFVLWPSSTAGMILRITLIVLAAAVLLIAAFERWNQVGRYRTRRARRDPEGDDFG